MPLAVDAELEQYLTEHSVGRVDADGLASYWYKEKILPQPPGASTLNHSIFESIAILDLGLSFHTPFLTSA